MANTRRLGVAAALCLGFTANLTWADPSHGSVRDRWVENPYQHHDTTGTQVRLGSLVAILAIDGTEYTGLGGIVAAGHRWGRFAIDAEYGYLEVTERGPSSLRYGVAHSVGVNARYELIRLGSRVVGPNSMAGLFVEGSLARQIRIADPDVATAPRPHHFPSGQTNQVAGGFGIVFDHRLEQPRGFPNRVAWQLGWRIVGAAPPEPDTFTTCDTTCTTASKPTSVVRFGLSETSLELSSSLAFTW